MSLLLNLARDYSDEKCEEVFSHFKSYVDNKVFSFLRNKALARLEDTESLKYYCMFKIHEAVKAFKYEVDLDEEANENRLRSLVCTYVQRILIDYNYTLNLKKRKPTSALVSMHEISVANDEGDEGYFEPVDYREVPPTLNAIYDEIAELIVNCKDANIRPIFLMMSQNNTPEDISRKLGINTSSVRSTIRRIRERAARVMK